LVVERSVEAPRSKQGFLIVSAALIAVDPGASGGFAYVDPDSKEVTAVPMPEGMTEQIDFLRSMSALGFTGVIIENVGYHMPGNSATASVKFSRHVGHLEAACYAFGMPVTYVAPQTWMKKLGAWSKDKKKRKAEIKEAMARKYPHLTVTLKTADALGILTVVLKGG
jgi:hypothetical protein